MKSEDEVRRESQKRKSEDTVRRVRRRWKEWTRKWYEIISLRFHYKFERAHRSQRTIISNDQMNASAQSSLEVRLSNTKSQFSLYTSRLLTWLFCWWYPWWPKQTESKLADSNWIRENAFIYKVCYWTIFQFRVFKTQAVNSKTRLALRSPSMPCVSRTFFCNSH